MNSCVLMVQVLQDPELRSASDNQMEIAEMLVQFPNGRSAEPATLRTITWNNLAREVKNNYKRGDWLVIEGRIELNTVDRPEGFKEKKAQFVATRVYPVAGDYQLSGGNTTPAAANAKPATGVAAFPTAPPASGGGFEAIEEDMGIPF
jgi:single-strand DNA-binding protein